MSFEAARRLAKALLFEGYALYPYRASALKNQRRWALGTLYPSAFCREPNDRSRCRAELLVQGSGGTRVAVTLCFLGPVAREEGNGAVWYEAEEHDVRLDEVSVGELVGAPRHHVFELPGVAWEQAAIRRRRHALRGTLAVEAIRVDDRMFRLAIEADNLAPFAGGDDRDAAYAVSLAAAHILVACAGGEILSAVDPPAAHAADAARCRQEGLYPVLVGAPGPGAVMLASPIALPDHPRIAPESPGDLFDATEIDEILTLRILTLGDAERTEAMADPRVRALLERTERLQPRDLMDLHGARRSSVSDVPLRVGDRVRLRPQRGGDVIDIVLAGETAEVCAIEEDLEGRVLFAVTVDADPGRDLGTDGQPGHRFFFRYEELEPLS